MIRSRFVLTAVAAAALVFSASTASAQVVSNSDVNVTVGDVLKLTLSTASVNAPAPGVSEFDAGLQDVGTAGAPAVTATVKSNRKWTLDVVGSNTTSWVTSPVGYAKAAANLQWGTCGATYPNSSAASANLANGAVGTAGTSAKVCYQIIWDYTKDIPGTYKQTMVYTLTGN